VSIAETDIFVGTEMKIYIALTARIGVKPVTMRILSSARDAVAGIAQM